MATTPARACHVTPSRHSVRKRAWTALLPALGPALVLAACGGEPTAPVAPPGTPPASPPALAVAISRTPAEGEWTLVTADGAALTAADTVKVNDASHATVDPDGRLFGKASGDVTITVERRNSAGTVVAAGSTAVSVAPRPSTQFPVVFDFIEWTPTDLERAAFERAAARLRTVLVAEDPPLDVTLQPGECLAPDGAAYQGIVGITIRVTTGALQGGIVGIAGPCLMTSEGRSKAGLMILDIDMLASVRQQGTWQAQRELEDIILHEAGHGLGLAAASAYAPVDASDPDAPRFTGSHAVAGYQSLGGSGPVPLTSDHAHWANTADLWAMRDVMLPAADAVHRLSPISLGALADLGYTVHLDRAEASIAVVRPTGAPPIVPSIARAPTELHHDVHPVPARVVPVPGPRPSP